VILTEPETRAARADPSPTPRKAVLVPPRPNLGPEPWPEAGSVVLALLAVVFLIASLSLIGLIVWLLRKPRKRGWLRAARDVQANPLNAPGSLRDQIIAHSHEIRAALATRFGASWRAMTTEEIADSPALADHLGPDRATRLVAFLRAADRAKFAGEDDFGTPQLSLDSTGIAELLSALRVEAGARSRINGK
jgi:hypothetical protein